MEGDQRLQALDLEFLKRAQHAPGGLRAIGVPHDQLGNHRVIHRRDLAARTHAGVDAHAWPRRLRVGTDPTRRRGEVLGGVLSVDAALDRVAAQHDVLLCVRQGLAGRRTDPLLDDVDAGGHLGHAVLHLDTRVHLQEVVLRRRVLARRRISAAGLRGEQALDRAGAHVADRLRGLHADLPDARPQLRRDDPLRRGRLLDQLLVAPLDRAVALAKVDHVAVPVGEHLHLDVAGVRQIALQVHGRVGEELLALTARALEGARQLLLAERHAEALAAASAGRLDRNGEADLGLDDRQRLIHRAHRLGGARHDRHPRLAHQRSRAGL